MENNLLTMIKFIETIYFLQTQKTKNVDFHRQ